LERQSWSIGSSGLTLSTDIIPVRRDELVATSLDELVELGVALVVERREATEDDVKDDTQTERKKTAKIDVPTEHGGKYPKVRTRPPHVHFGPVTSERENLGRHITGSAAAGLHDFLLFDNLREACFKR